MTLLDAPKYDLAKGRRRRNIILSVVAACLIVAGFLWFFWDWPEEQLVNQFFAAVQAGDMPKAFGIWNHDPDWQKHPQNYAAYNYGRFLNDWGHASEWGDIKSHKIVMTRTVGSGVVLGVLINGRKVPVFLWVQRSNRTLGFSPVSLSDTGGAMS